jgi:hypothetical protein
MKSLLMSSFACVIIFFKAPRMPAFAMEAARELLAFAKDHIGPSMVTKVSA